MIRRIYIIITQSLVAVIQSVTVIVTVIVTVAVTVTVIVYRRRHRHRYCHRLPQPFLCSPDGKQSAMSNWSPPPASLLAWAQDQEGDDNKLKDVKALLSITTERMLDTHSKFLAKKRFSEELERYVKDMIGYREAPGGCEEALQ